MADFSISKGITFDGEEKATVNVTVNISYSNDAPPALAHAIAESVGKILALGLPEETCDEIGRELMEIKERKQREIDHVSAQLLADLDEPNGSGQE